jgi:nitronate monooxygenase
MIRTRLTDSFGLEHPIVCAPMALVTGGALATAVSQAGGLGVIAGGYAGVLGGEPDLEAEIDAAGEVPVGVGFITWALAQRPAVLGPILARRPRCLFLSFGDPVPFARQAHDAGIPVICQVQRLEHVDAALRAGAVAVVAQGTEAGGHGGHRATLSFLPEVADRVAARAPDTLVLAAGGIADGRGLAAALALGADGVVVGSRFWASREALTPQPMIDRAVAADGDATVRTKMIDALRGVPWPEEFSFRVLRNRLTDAWADRDADPAAVYGTFAHAYAAARAEGDLETVATVVGEAVGLIADRPPAGDIIDRMVRDAEGQLQRGAGFVTAG